MGFMVFRFSRQISAFIFDGARGGGGFCAGAWCYEGAGRMVCAAGWARMGDDRVNLRVSAGEEIGRGWLTAGARVRVFNFD